MNRLRRPGALLALALGALGALAASAPSPAHAEELALVNAEAHVAHGIAQSGGGGMSNWRESTYLLGLTVDVAIVDEPWTSLYGTLEFEGFDRAAVGGFVGLRLRPTRGAFRLAAGAGGMFVPYSALGVSASGGACRRKSPHVCFDLEGNFLFAGSDIPDGRVASQFLLKLGLAFDVL
jgi:hypothetical protein